MTYMELNNLQDNFKRLIEFEVKRVKDRLINGYVKNFEEFTEYRGGIKGLVSSLEFLKLAHKAVFNVDELSEDESQHLLNAGCTFPMTGKLSGGKHD